ncbi:hypothetical protein [Rarobacter faecitabidus]|uniref:Uncharacterized protein n=1 Tax=Rarobacter faecitabidus TaxID=13243 RepID=A0A542ZX65_RARFA|nr:hypothetical protein [Rarobacter faecitabidus]TQL64944.1 hypothetical protein FB461_1476 [Rarobacter faecitabidus]
MAIACLVALAASACGTIPTTDAQNPVLRAKPVEDAMRDSGFALQCTNEDAATGVARDNTYPWRAAYFIGRGPDIGAALDAITNAGFTFKGQPHRDLATLPAAVPVPPDETVEDTAVAWDTATGTDGAGWSIGYYKDEFTLACGDVDRWGTVIHLRAGEIGIVTNLMLPELN